MSLLDASPLRVAAFTPGLSQADESDLVRHIWLNLPTGDTYQTIVHNSPLPFRGNWTPTNAVPDTHHL